MSLGLVGMRKLWPGACGCEQAMSLGLLSVSPGLNCCPGPSAMTRKLHSSPQNQASGSSEKSRGLKKRQRYGLDVKCPHRLTW